MKISHKLPQFNEERALLVVATRQTATLYSAHKGRIQEIGQIEVPNPTYSDREGFFARSGKGMRFGSGSVYEAPTEKARKEFLKKVSPAIKKALLKKSFETIYLFVSTHLAKATLNALPSPARRLVKRIFKGNFVNYAPFELLAKIRVRRVAKRKAASLNVAPAAAKKILRKARKARKVVGKRRG